MLFIFLKPYVIQTEMPIITVVPTNIINLYRHCLTTLREGAIDTQFMKDSMLPLPYSAAQRHYNTSTRNVILL